MEIILHTVCHKEKAYAKWKQCSECVSKHFLYGFLFKHTRPLKESWKLYLFKAKKVTVTFIFFIKMTWYLYFTVQCSNVDRKEQCHVAEKMIDSFSAPFQQGRSGPYL